MWFGNGHIALHRQGDDHVDGHGEGHLGDRQGDGDHVGGHRGEVGEGEEEEGHDDADGV